MNAVATPNRYLRGPAHAYRHKRLDRTVLIEADVATDKKFLQAKDALIDINRAKADELMTLKGIGEARAAAIIKGRPYARKDELVQKKILPESVYNEIKDRIIAKQGPTALG